MAEKCDYEAVLADLRAQRDEIDVAIAALERLMARAGMNHAAAPMLPLEPVNRAIRLRDSITPTGLVTVAAAIAQPYKGMTIKKAARAVLTEAGRTQGTPVIAHSIEAGGFKHKSENFSNTVRSTLSREEDFVRVGSEWGLREWYPESAKQKEDEAKDRPA